MITLWRIIKFGFQSFVRNFWLSLVTITIITLSLLSISALGAVTVASNEALSNLQDKIDISVYLKPKLTEGQIYALRGELEALDGVKQVTYVSADEALAKFRAKYENNEQIGEALILLGVNPLGASLVVKAQSEDGYQQILNRLEEGDYDDIIQEARFDDYRQVIAGIADLTANVKTVGVWISGLFLLIALMVVFNTMRINIYTHRQEIEIERLVGATNWFIRGPFWVESILYALVATLITAIIFYASLSWVQPYIVGLFNGSSFNLVEYFTSSWFTFFGTQFITAALLNMAAAGIAMRRYLRV